jgi:sugar phosphate isomerase/epimerase
MALHMNAFTPLPLLTAPRRFRLGLTSYVYPSDLLTNVRQLAPFADDIEIVFFESKEACNFPSPAEVEELRQLAEQHQLSYTIHFPIDKALGSANQEEREEFMGVALRIIELCRPLKPFGWILHLEGIEATASPARVDAWRHDLAPLLRVLAGMVDDPTRFCVENLGYPFAWCEPLLLDNPFSVCLDLGHLLQMGYDWRRHVTQWLPRTRIVHLYGSNTTSRHYSLEMTPKPLVQDFLASLKTYRGVLTLETFGFEDTAPSLTRLQECLADS